MTPIRTLFVLALLFGPGPLLAAELQELVLDDGSTLVAEVRGLEGGVYRLESPTLGALEIAQQRVRRNPALREVTGALAPAE